MDKLNINFLASAQQHTLRIRLKKYLKVDNVSICKTLEKSYQWQIPLEYWAQK